MSFLAEMPEWFGEAVIGAIFAALGFLSKSAIDWWKEKRSEKSTLHKRLREMASLLVESKNLFLTQNELARRLLNSLQVNNNVDLSKCDGFEDAFSLIGDNFTQEEKDLHSMIRGITKNSLRRVNLSMSKWLNEDLAFKTGKSPLKKPQNLADYLVQLERHLNLWHDKYKVWIPDKPQHALVYVGDEKGHGIPFPKGIEEIASSALLDFD